MKPTPLETKLLDNFKPGKITKDGFLGDETRHIHDIIKKEGVNSYLPVYRNILQEGIAV